MTNQMTTTQRESVSEVTGESVIEGDYCHYVADDIPLIVYQ